MPERRNVVLAAMTAIALTLAPSGSTAQIIGEPAHICVQDCAVRTGPVFVDVQAQRLRQLSDRYQQVWQRLKAEGLAVDDLRLPQITPNESLLTLNVDRLHSAAVRNLDVLQMDWDTLPLERTHYERALDSRLDARRDAEDALRKMPARMAGTQANYDRLSKEVTIEESRFRQLDQAANRVRSQEAKTAQSLIYWLGPFLNARDRATLARTIDNRWMPPVETYEKIARLPPPSPAAVAAAPAQPYVFNSRIPPTGPVENKLTGVENVASQIASLRPRVEQESARVTEARRAFEAEREASAGVIERAATAKAQAEKLEATTLALQDRVRDALQNQLHAADNLVRYAAYSYLWSDLKERVVVPAVRDYVTSNGLA